MQIINHLADLSNYCWDWTEQDKEMFIQLERNLITKGYKILYMNKPVETTCDGDMTAICVGFHENINSVEKLTKQMLKLLCVKNKYKHLFNNRIYIYKIGKLKCIKDDVTFFVYTIRIGTDYKFN